MRPCQVWAVRAVQAGLNSTRKTERKDHDRRGHLNQRERLRSSEVSARYAVDAEKLRLFNATREEMSRWFGVQEMFLDIWAEQHDEFAKALQVEPITTLRVTDDFGLTNWLKDYRRGNLNI